MATHPYYRWQQPIAIEYHGRGIFLVKFVNPIVLVNPDDRAESISGWFVCLDD